MKPTTRFSNFKVMSALFLVCILFGFTMAPVNREVFPQDFQEPSADWRNVNVKSFQAGEKAIYRVHYGFLTAGTAEFYLDKATTKYRGRECYRAHGYVKTASAFEWFYKVRNEFHTYVDKNAIFPWYYTRKSAEGSYRFADTVSFDQTKRVIKGTKGEFKAPEYTQDVMSAFYYARSLDLKNAKVGTVHKINTFLDDNIYNLGLTVIKRETIKTEFGKVRCIKIAPIMVAGRIFKEKDQMYLWVTDDDNLIPMRVESPILVGSIKCDLVKYENIRNPFSSLVK